LEAAGAVSVCVGAFLVSPALGFTVSGLAAIGAGFVLGGDAR
jgi:hypothetical protein